MIADWERVRSAYSVLIGRADPVGPLVAEFGATDLRPAQMMPREFEGGLAVVSGPDDLIELRTAVERVTGLSTWPVAAPEQTLGPSHRSRLDLARPAEAMGLVVAMEGILGDNAGAWRTWKTVLEAIGAGVADLRQLTLEAVVVDQKGASVQL